MSQKNEAIAKKKVIGRFCPEFRFSFARIAEPQRDKETNKPRWTTSMLFPKKADLSVLKSAAKAAVLEKYPDGKTPKNFVFPFKDGDEMEDYPENAGHIVVSAGNKKKQPPVFDHTGAQIDASEIYSGCYGKATLLAFCYDVNGKKGVSFALLGVQKTRDGEQLSGGGNVGADFDAVETDGASASGGASEDELDAMMG